MQTIGEYIDEIQGRYSKGIKSTDSRLSNRMVYSKMKEVRSKLINEKANKNQTFSDAFYQLLSGAEMEQVSSSMLSTFNLSNVLFSTKYNVPTFVYSRDAPLIASVSNVEASVIYNRTSWQTLKNSKGRKFTSDKPNYLLLENKIFTDAKVSAKAIAIRGIFEDPIDAYKFPVFEDCSVKCTTNMEIPFYVDKDMANTIVEITAIHFIEIYSKLKDDREQNDVDNT